MIIRRLDPAEWRTARHLRVAALTESPEAFGSTVLREQGLEPDAWLARLTDNAWFAALDDERAVGLACGVRTQTPEECELTGMWVAPVSRGSGVGDALVTAVRDWAVLEGARRLTLVVVGSNTSATALYERHGFLPSSPAEAAGHVLREQDIAMSLDLRSSAAAAGS